MQTMSKNKPEKAKPEPAPEAPPKPTSIRLSGDVAAAMEKYIEAQKWPPSSTQVIERALIDFFRKEGFWPAEQSPDEG